MGVMRFQAPSNHFKNGRAFSSNIKKKTIVSLGSLDGSLRREDEKIKGKIGVENQFQLHLYLEDRALI